MSNKKDLAKIKEIGLNAKQVAFSINMVGGMTQESAYREATGSQGNPTSLQKSGCEWAKNEKIVKYMIFLGEKAEKETLWTRKRALDCLGEIIEKDMEEGNGKIATTAIAQMSKIQGWEAAQKFEHTGADGGAIERVERVIVDPKVK